MKILVTGFEPFGGETRNPSEEVLKHLAKEKPLGVSLIPLLLPVSFSQSLRILLPWIDKEKPQAVICFGQAAGQSAVVLERIGINLQDASLKDNDGEKPLDTPCVKEGPAAYFSTFPVREMVQGLQDAGIPAGVSYSAGTFVCNHLLYGVLHHINHTGTGIPAGFVHLPSLPEQVLKNPKMPSMGLEMQVRAAYVLLSTLKKGSP